MSESPSQYTKANPFLAKITERYSLCKPGSLKSTYHVVLDLRGSGITYQVGDSIAVQACNDPSVVDRTLQALHATGEETIADRHTQEPIGLRDYLSKKANLSEVPRKLIALMAQRQTNASKKERLEFLFNEGQKELLKEYQEAHEVWDALAENEEAQISPQELCNILQPLLPRFYSIASSMAEVGEEVHLTVAELKYETNGYQRMGVCTHYLCNLAPMHASTIPVYLQPSHGFTVPQASEAALIMVGPGTGVAPYRGFMQERLVRGSSGAHWLFFGECHRASEFYYEEYWQELVESGALRLDTAFSRDQEHKIYVQHQMLEQGREIFEWLEKGAYFYVCGDAKRMAKDVDAALHLIIQNYCGGDEQAAKDYMKRLKSEKRYLRDVY